MFLDYLPKRFESVKVEKHQNLSIALTMIASFTLAFAYLYWQGNMGRRAPVQLSPSLSQSVATATPTPLPPWVTGRLGPCRRNRRMQPFHRNPPESTR